MMAGSDTGNGRASSLTDTASCSPSRASRARRVGSANAANVRSSALILNHMVKYLVLDAQCQGRDAMRVSSGTLGVLPPPLWGGLGWGGSAVSAVAGASHYYPHPQPLPTRAGLSHMTEHAQRKASSHPARLIFWRRDVAAG